MLGMAAGNALGHLVELGASPGSVSGMPKGACWDDEVSLATCVVEALVASRPDPRPVLGTDAAMDSYMEALSQRMVAWGQEQPVVSGNLGSTNRGACEMLLGGTHWSVSGSPDSLGSGCAPRAVPLGLYFSSDLTKVVRYGIETGGITHSHVTATCASVASALCAMLAVQDVPIGLWPNEIHCVVKGMSKQFEEAIDMATRAAAGTDGVEKILPVLGTGYLAHEAVACALFCCMRSPSDLERAVLLAANLAGDADTIASMVGAWMGARLGEDAIPTAWRENLLDAEKVVATGVKLFDAQKEVISR